VEEKKKKKKVRAKTIEKILSAQLRERERE
jgi:hypothetical protein